MKKIIVVKILAFNLLICGLIFPSEIKIEVKRNSFKMFFELQNMKNVVEQKGKFSLMDYYEFADADHTSEFRLPFKEIIVAIPANTKPTITLIPDSEIILENTVPVKNTCLLEIYNNKPASDGATKPLIEVMGYFWFREFYCVRLRISTHLFDENTCRIKEIKKFNIEFTFSSDVSISDYSPVKVLSKYDDLYQSILSNHEIAEQFRSKPSFSIGDSSGTWIQYDNTYLKMGTAVDALLRIGKQDLERMNINADFINPETFKLYESGNEIPIFVSGESDGRFDDEDYIEFWGSVNYTNKYRIINKSNETYNNYINIYTDSTFYFLSWNGSKGKRASVNMFNNPTSDTINYYSHFYHVENNTMFQFMNNDETQNQMPNWYKNKSWVWSWIFAGSYNYTFSAPDLVKNKSAQVLFKLISTASNTPLNSHNLKLSLNDVKLDSQVVNRYQQALLKGKLNSVLLKPDKNTITIQNFANGTSPNQIALDWYEFEYPRSITLTNDSLYFQISEDINEAVRVIKIDNVKHGNYIIYKVKPLLKKINYFHLKNFSLFFTDSVKGGDAYIIISPPKIGKPNFLYSKPFLNLRAIERQGDYIGITHKKFWNVAVEYIKEVGKIYSVTTALFDVQDIFDEFGFGYPRPEAIKEFLKYSFQNWGIPKPSYLCLIGDANYDWHNYLLRNAGVKGGGNYVPSYGVPVSDNWYAVWDDNTLPLPQLKVGRLPVNYPQELQWYLNKVKNNFDSPYDSWNKRYLFFSGGNPQKAEETRLLKSVNDTILQKYIIPKPIAGNYYHFYKTSSPLSDFGPYSFEQISNAVDGGGIFISYIGHSGTATWDNSISEVEQLRNLYNRNPLITDFGCSTNKFAEPDIVSFGERFVLNPMGQALGYIGNSSLGFTNTATTLPERFYKSIIESDNHEIGSAHIKSKMLMFDEVGNTTINQIFSLTNVIIGDPLVSLKIPHKPNLFISNHDLKINQKSILASQDSIPLIVNIYNYGTSTFDSITLSFVHQYKNNVTGSGSLRISSPEYHDSVTIWLKIRELPGTHSVSIDLDKDNNLAEIYEDDNEALLEFNVYSADMRGILYNEIENGDIDIIIFLNPIIADEETSDLIFQYSGNPNFDSYIEINEKLKPFFTNINLPSLDVDQRYCFRTKLGHEGALFSPIRSFRPQISSKFLLCDNISFQKQILNNLRFDSSKIFLSLDSVKVSVISAGWSAGANCVITKDGKNLLSNTYFAGLGIVVFDPVTMNVDTSEWYTLFGQPGNVIQLTKLINEIPAGKIVVMGVSDDAANNMTQDLKTAIKSLGSTKIDQLKFRGSWALIGRKGAEPGNVIEMIRGPYDGSIYIDSIFSVQNLSGRLLTKNIGPAAKWKNIRIAYKKPEDSQIVVLVNGIKKDGNMDLLREFQVSDSTINLDTLDSSIYAYLKLNVQLNAASDGSSPFVSMIGVDFVGVPELGTNYQVVSVSKDSVVQGDSLSLDFYVYNVGESPADSFNVRVELVKPDNSVRLLMDSLVTRIDSMSRKSYSLIYHPALSDGTGNMKFRILMDSENKITELYKDNNVYESSFYVRPDTTTTSVSSASLDVTFDGVCIAEGDYVSVNPQVQFTLSYPVWFPVQDTTAVQVYLDNERIYYSQMNFFSDTINRKAIFIFEPLLENGEHHLRVLGKNIIGKVETSSGYEVFFNVQNELKLLNVFNYPNPFKSNTSFTFTLTQMPDDVNIRIYTVAGRLIKQINAAIYGLHAGFNSVPWDGKDEDGNDIANGVYLYKVVVKKGDKSEDITQKLAIVR